MKITSRILTVPIFTLLLSSCKDSPSTEADKTSTLPTHQFSTASSASSKTFSLPSLEEKLGKIHPENLEFHKDDIRKLLSAHPDQAEAILEHFSSLLFEHSPAEAITFAMSHSEYLPSGAGDRISAQLLKNWHSEDSTALETHFHTLAKHKGGTEQECHKALQLLMKPADGAFDTSTWLTWLSTLSKGHEQNGELQGEALNAMLSLSDPKDSAQLTPLLAAYHQRLNDAGIQKHLPNVADVIAKHRPEESKRLLADMPGGSYRDEVLQRTIAELGRSHPEVGAEWLSSPDVLKNIFRPEFEADKEEAQQNGVPQKLIEEAEQAFQEHVNSVFDRTLETYIFSIVHQHPEDAIKNVESLLDSERRELLRTRVQAIVETL